MKIIINEDKITSLLLSEIINEYEVSDGNAFHNPYKKKFERGKKLLRRLVEREGKIMTCMENGDDYYVYEIYSLSQLLGVRYALCRIIRDKKASGTVLIKPLEMFKVKNY